MYIYTSTYINMYIYIYMYIHIYMYIYTSGCHSHLLENIAGTRSPLPNVQWFRSRLEFEAHTLLHHSAEGSRTYLDL